MARPETHNDIRDSWGAGDKELARINTIELLKMGTVNVVTAAFALMEAAEKAGYTIDREGQWQIKREPTTEELDKVLEDEQRSWDSARDNYQKAVEDPEAFIEESRYLKWVVDRHAEKEDLPAIAWPETED